MWAKMLFLQLAESSDLQLVDPNGYLYICIYQGLGLVDLEFKDFFGG